MEADKSAYAEVHDLQKNQKNFEPIQKVFIFICRKFETVQITEAGKNKWWKSSVQMVRGDNKRARV